MVFCITVKLEEDNSYYSHLYATMEIYRGTIIRKQQQQKPLNLEVGGKQIITMFCSLGSLFWLWTRVFKLVLLLEPYSFLLTE